MSGLTPESSPVTLRDASLLAVSRRFIRANLEDSTVAHFSNNYLYDDIHVTITHYSDIIMGALASQISIACSPVGTGADQRNQQSPASLAFVRGFHQWPVDSPHKGPITQKRFPFDGVIMIIQRQHESGLVTA